ncbi:MAG: polysaccharide biosynthesis/export family protein [Planctomycetota bacterium]
MAKLSLLAIAVTILVALQATGGPEAPIGGNLESYEDVILGGVTTQSLIDWRQVQLCQALGPAAPFSIWGVDSLAAGGCGEPGWEARGYVNWQAYAQGEYVGHARTPHVPEYRLRVDDRIAFVFRLTRDVTKKAYELQVGDRISVESLTADSGGQVADGGAAADNIRRELVIQPDGSISLPLLGQVRAEGLTVDGLRQKLEEAFGRFYRVPSITVTPLRVNTRLNDLLESVDARQGSGGIQLETRVNPEGDRGRRG